MLYLPGFFLLTTAVDVVISESLALQKSLVDHLIGPQMSVCTISQ